MRVDDRSDKLKKFREYCQRQVQYIEDEQLRRVAALAFEVGYLASLLTDEQVETLPEVSS